MSPELQAVLESLQAAAAKTNAKRMPGMPYLAHTPPEFTPSEERLDAIHQEKLLKETTSRERISI